MLEENIRKVTPYVPGEQPQCKVIKLNTNENPYPPAPGVKEALRNLDTDRLRLYPDPEMKTLISALAEFYGVKKEQVFAGVGSDDVLSMCFLTFFNSGKPILFPDITYSFYKVWADLYRIPYECQPLDENLRIRKEDYEKENGGIIFPNPNAPTSIYEDLSFVEDILKKNRDVIVIVDEAYIDFAGPSAVRLIDTYDNLIVTQTFSKSRSMAGMRIGFAIGNERLIRWLNDVKYSFNSYTLSYPSIVCGTGAVKDRAYFEETTERIIRTRTWVQKELKELGFIFPESSTNFIFAKHPDYSGTDLFEALRNENIYVRHWNDPAIKEYLRISVGTDEEMETFLNVLRAVMKKR
ncbi:histidinol-phosphate transaminase [Sellimonas caecigallum]|uniref:Histidinol-phosphate aminotransferase n=1 Tax=Sellimonas caecigallum TaxID=2592333 RepID=A0ABS7L3Z4_9FIRM|nr:histidinol-phosphate transaminase [Sellimonas caecigallum]MBY0757754.1 histidinol-phosphate transaminase [Sellimonas caecigallum]